MLRRLGTILQYFENYNDSAVRQRVKIFCDYIESILENSHLRHANYWRDQ
jgi:hypothetical protein